MVRPPLLLPQSVHRVLGCKKTREALDWKIKKRDENNNNNNNNNKKQNIVHGIEAFPLVEVS